MHIHSSCLSLVLAISCLAGAHTLKAGRQANDTAILGPWLELERKDLEKLAHRGVVVRSLSAADKQIGVIAACAVAISPDAFLARVRATGDLKRAPMSGRFSDPPSPADLAMLTLDQGDIDRLRRCRSGDCRLNLADHEIASMQLALRESASGSSIAAQEAFRRVVLDRVTRYRAGGLAALPDYNDRTAPVRPAVIFSEILRQIPHLRSHAPGAAAYLERFPSNGIDGADSSLLWTKMTMNDKPVVMVTHVAAFRPGAAEGVPSVLVARKQVYASRYMNGDLMLTMLFAGAGGSPGYLLVINRSQLDELTGMFSRMKRAAIESRVKEEAAKALAALRDDLERTR